MPLRPHPQQAPRPAVQSPTAPRVRRKVRHQVLSVSEHYSSDSRTGSVGAVCPVVARPCVTAAVVLRPGTAAGAVAAPSAAAVARPEPAKRSARQVPIVAPAPGVGRDEIQMDRKRRAAQFLAKLRQDVDKIKQPVIGTVELPFGVIFAKKKK